MLEVRLLAKDEHGTVLSYCNESVTVKKEGPVEIVPESPVTLRGGAGGFFVKSAGKKGSARITVTDWKGNESVIKISVVKK